MQFRLPTAIALAILLSGCFSSKPPATPPSDTPSTSVGTAPSIFPHKSDWKNPEQHGLYVKDVLDLNVTTCLGCHKETDSVSGGAPSCRSCHAVFPHNDPGITFDTHGDYVLKNGKTACATKCHGSDLQGGLSGVACTKCHTVYPHASGWSTPSVHGPQAKGDLKLKNECNHCHGDDWKGGTSKTSCVDCHKGSYPHPEGWANPEQHGAFALQNGTGKCATQCHGMQLEGGLSGKSCNDCHKIWPHPASGWMAAHGDTARSIGLNGCLGCHKDDATGGKTGVSCAKCHAALPAHQDTDWDKTGHGKLVMQQQSALTDPKGCPLCHGAKLEGGKDPTLPGLTKLKGCTDCHASYPALHKPAAGAPAWNAYEGHAKWVLSQVNISKGAVLDQTNTLIADCKLCHGPDLAGGNTGKSCYKCHTTFPHNADPADTAWLGKHGAIASKETQSGVAAISCATANCHGTDLKGSPAGVVDISKKLVLGCTDCHLQMPHQKTWLQTHGASAAIKLSDCTKCHGDNLKGKDNIPSCYQCHDNFPLPHRNADGTPNTQWKPMIGADFHGAVVMAAAGATAKDKAKTLKCNICHDSSNNGNPTPSCYSCHPSAPHAPAPVTAGGITYTFTNEEWNGLGEFAKSHGQYVVARAKLAGNGKTISQQATEECGTQCHGVDFLGGISQKPCYTCHTTYPHPADWYHPYKPEDIKTPGGTHGFAAVRSGTAACLTACHGADGSGGNSGKACTTCHNYPHKAGWKDDHAANAEYPPHALFVINTNGTPATKNDDTFNAAAFDNCAKCHGPTIDFLRLEVYPLPDGDKTKVTLDPGVTVPRCTACHIYPHKKIQNLQSVMTDWKSTHKNAYFYWKANPGFTLPESSCGTAEGKAGCHTSGPTQTFDPTKPVSSTNPTLGTQDGCNYCHK